jgi:hypothetical protein
VCDGKKQTPKKNMKKRFLNSIVQCYYNVAMCTILTVRKARRMLRYKTS